ncbi:MAG: N-acetylmuramoyl-L-alanine amidase [Blautia sp.]|nr:N-acetylmuramoyl-L-alanine amidase [Lachnoclostridium sp.]MCM1211921.1 N-acetylmuramoyl-L-alanine amidase [Blautia sp.]
MQSSVQKKQVRKKASTGEKELSMIDFSDRKAKPGRSGEVALWELEPPEKRPGTGQKQKANQRQRTGQRQSASQSQRVSRRQGVSQNRAASYRAQERYAGTVVRDYQSRAVQSRERRLARRRRAYLYRALALSMVLLCLTLLCLLVGFIIKCLREDRQQEALPVANIPVSDEAEVSAIEAPDIMTDFLEINEYSRPGTAIEGVKSIFVHYTANPGTSAAQNRSYFASLAETRERSASAHFIIGYEGEIIQCIPLEEQAYAVMTRNNDSISIECCYLDEDGKFTQETYDSLIHILAWLTEEYNLEEEDILRHYDCGGKLCPLYYVEHENAWDQLLVDVKRYREDNRNLETAGN